MLLADEAEKGILCISAFNTDVHPTLSQNQREPRARHVVIASDNISFISSTTART
jgi:hypothetical protein